jgi:3-oxoacyl-[acyl-carrier protein] reductase
VTIASSGVVQPIQNLPVSNGLRASIVAWMKTLSSEVASEGITVNVVLPGRIDTDRVKQIDGGASKATGKPIDEIQRLAIEQIPAGRYGTVDEFASVVAFLASQQASYITGSVIRVDGGLIRAV